MATKSKKQTGEKLLTWKQWQLTNWYWWLALAAGIAWLILNVSIINIDDWAWWISFAVSLAVIYLGKFGIVNEWQQYKTDNVD